MLISNGWGGAEAWVYALIRYLRDKGENVSLITNEEMVKYYTDLENISLCNIGALFPPKSVIPHIRAERIKMGLVRRGLLLFYYYLDEPLCYRYYERIRKRVLQFLSLNQVQVIHSHLSLSSILVSSLGELKIPTVATDHGEHVLRGLVPVHPLERPVVNWRARRFSRALGKADKVAVVSDFMLNALEDWGIPLAGKAVVIPVGINVSEIQGSSRSTLELKGKFNLLFPGGWKWTKGGDLLMAALPKVKQEMADIHLYIALDVPWDRLLRKMASELNLEGNVTFTGFLAVPEYRRLLNSVDLFVLPSRLEAFAVSILEAMALGKPIIASNAGGTPEVVQSGRNGILVDLDPDEIAQAILYLYKNESLRREISQNNLKDIARFDLSSVVEQHIKFYGEVLNVGQLESM